MCLCSVKTERALFDISVLDSTLYTLVEIIFVIDVKLCMKNGYVLVVLCISFVFQKTKPARRHKLFFFFE